MKAFVGIAVLIVAAPLLLVPLYWIVPPVSTLMAADRLSGREMSRTWVALDAIAPALPRAVLVSEDARYCLHHGVDWGALGAVLEEPGGPSRGASTIPMQAMKNLFLWPSRSYLRKALEIPLALYADLVWSKRRMMEIYLNIVEWGPGVYGAEAAARTYFGVPAAQLTPRQAALMASALPNPIQRNPGSPGPGHARLAATIEAREAGADPWSACLRL